MRTFQYKGEIYCAEFQMEPLKFHTKYLLYILKDMISHTTEVLRDPRIKWSSSSIDVAQLLYWYWAVKR